MFLNIPYILEAFDSSFSDYRQIIHITKIDNFALDHYKKSTVFSYIMYFYYYLIILGDLWL